MAAAPTGGDPVEVLLDGGDPFEAVTAPATVGSTIGAALINALWPFLAAITAFIDAILNNGNALTLALLSAAAAACSAVGGTPLSEFGVFYRCLP